MREEQEGRISMGSVATNQMRCYGLIYIYIFSGFAMG